MIFSITLIILLILVTIIVWRIKTKPKEYLCSFLETGTPNLSSYRLPERIKNKYFPYSEGIIDVSKHPELLRFKEVSREKEYLVEPWKRTHNLYIEKGITKVVIYEILNDEEGNFITMIPCLRTVDMVMKEINENSFSKQEETCLEVCWDGQKKVIKSDFLLGIVRYESI